MTKTAMKTKLRRVTKKIVREFRPDKVVLFGSWAWGKPSKDSDVDLLVIKKTANTRLTAKKIDATLFPREFPMDILVYNSTTINEKKQKDFFLQNILEKGRTLYEKNPPL